MYEVEIEIKPLAHKKWTAIMSQCAGKIDSMVELLQGTISRGVMEVVTRKGEGIFPAPQGIFLRCSCPDWATMCKHVAAVLYGVGARLDHEPQMLFTLRGVEPAELIAAALTDVPTTRKSGRRRLLNTDDMSSVFGIALDTEAVLDGDKAFRRTRRRKKPTKTRAAAAHKKPGSRTKAAKKSASAKSAGKKKTASKRAKAVAVKIVAKESGTRKLNARKKTVRKVTARRPKKTAS